MPRSDLKLVAGLDLARRSDHSALVLLDVEADRLTVCAALRLPQAPLRQQFALIAPHPARLDLLVFERKGGCYAHRHPNRHKGQASKLVRALRDSTFTLPSAVRRISLSMS